MTFLGYFLLGIAGAMLIYGVRWAAVNLPAAFGAGQGWQAVFLVLMPGAILPAVWTGTAGSGLLLGKAWGRGLVLTMAVLALVFFAGTVTGVRENPVKFGALLGMLLSTGGASLYLFSHRTDGWFGRKPQA